MKSSRFHPNSAPILSGEGKVRDLFFGCDDEAEEDYKMSYHQRKHSRYPKPPTTEDGHSVGNNSSKGGSSSKAILDSLTKKQTNPWKNSKHRNEQLSHGNKQVYTNLVSSPLVPKAILDSPMKKQTNPWKNSKHRNEQLS